MSNDHPESSNIESTHFDPETQVMRVNFRTGSSYDYHGVTPEIYKTFLEAPSKGRYLHSVIKPGVPCSLCDD